MRIRSLVAAAVVVSTSSLAIAADTAKGMWDGCGEGSWVESKTTTKMAMPGMDLPANVSEMRQTLTKVTDAEWTVKTETKSGDTWTTVGEMAIPRKFTGAVGDAPKPEELGTESVKVEGKDYSCKKVKVSVSGATTITWISADQGALKSETQMPGGGTSTMEVTALAKTVKVGGKDVVCRESKTSMKASGMDSTTVSLSSDAIPGHSVRNETTSSGQVAMQSVTEVVAFEIK